MTSQIVLVNDAVSYLKSILKDEQIPELGLVLGSGFRSLSERIENKVVINFSDVPGFLVPSVQGHGSSIVVGSVGSKRVCILTGRSHLYEGYSAHQVVFSVRVLAKLGLKRIILTNAAGSLSEDLNPGELMIIRDQINMTGTNCLIGSQEFGPQFVDMANCFNQEWMEKIAQTCPAMQLGTYVGVIGPAYESAAEAKMLASLGGHAVGMSTVLEVMALRQLNVKCAGLSLITNYSGGNGEAVDHKDVLKLAGDQSNTTNDLLCRIIQNT